MSMNDVRMILDPDEPDYGRAKDLGPEAFSLLAELVRGDDAMLASKAVYLAALIDAEGGEEVVMQAARSPLPELRVAAAAATRNLPAQAANPIVLTLIDDPDRGVQRMALKSIPSATSPEVRRRLEAVSESGAGPDMRELARRALSDKV